MDIDKSINKVELLQDVNIVNTDFYVLYDDRLVRIPFSVLQDKLPLLVPAAVLIDDTTNTDVTTYSAQKIESLLSGKLDTTAKVNFEMLDNSAKQSLLDYVRENANITIDYNILGQFVDDENVRNDMTYSSEKIENEIAKVADQGLKDGCIQGNHFSEESLQYIVKWIQDNGYYFERIVATDFIINGLINDTLILTPLNTPYILDIGFSPGDANSGTGISYTTDNTCITIDRKTGQITTTEYDVGDIQVVATLDADTSKSHSFALIVTKYAFKKAISGTVNEPVSFPILSESGTDTKLLCSDNAIYGNSGGISLNNGSNNISISTSAIRVKTSNMLKITLKMSDIITDTITAGSSWIRITFVNGAYYDYSINTVSTLQSRMQLYKSSGTRIANDFGSLMSNYTSDTDNPGAIAKSCIVTINIDLTTGKIQTTSTGYFNNDWTIPTTNYNSRTTTSNATADGDTADAFFGLDDGNGLISSIIFNKSQKYNCTINDMTIEYI